MKKFLRDYSQEKLVTHHVDRVLIQRLLSYLYPYRWYLLISVVFILISKAIEAFVPIYLGIIAQNVLNQVEPSGFQNAILNTNVYVNCLFVMGLLLLSYAIDSVNVWIKSWIGQRAIFTMRSQVYEHIQKLPMAYYDKHSVGQLMTRTIHDVDQIDQMFSESVVPIIGNIVLFLCIGIGIIIINWKAALAISLILPFVWLMTRNFRINQRKCYEMVRAIVSAMNIFVQEHLMGASTIRSFGLQKKEKERFEEINEDHCSAYLDSIHNFSLFIASIDFFQSLTLITVFAVLVIFAPAETGFQAGMYFTFSLYALMFYRPLADLAERYNLLQSAMAAAEKVFHVLDLPTEPSGPTQGPGPDLNKIETIEFDDVWFAYEKENWILKGVSFSISHGESVAIVGITGAGKTSLISLLLRFYEFQKGSIRINGRDIREYPVQMIRSQFSIVLQDPVIFSGTISDNIALYDENISQKQIHTDIEYMKMDRLVNRFNKGINSELTERGKSLSTGERQLISMARAVAHERSVLILDEATANIDTKTERTIQDALIKILNEKTALVIAHRLSTIKDVNRILVMHNGRVVESGTHTELLKANGIYEKLYRLQFENT